MGRRSKCKTIVGGVNPIVPSGGGCGGGGGGVCVCVCGKGNGIYKHT